MAEMCGRFDDGHFVWQCHFQGKEGVDTVLFSPPLLHFVKNDCSDDIEAIKESSSAQHTIELMNIINCQSDK